MGGSDESPVMNLMLDTRLSEFCFGSLFVYAHAAFLNPRLLLSDAQCACRNGWSRPCKLI